MIYQSKFNLMLLSVALFINGFTVYAQETIFPGADENTPSKAQYFSWINNTNEGPTEAQTLTNLAFFEWLNATYGMQLDIYAFDAGAIDGKRFYGSMKSSRFKSQFPNSFDPIYKKTQDMGVRLGVWGGPDGFGDTHEEEQARIEQMVSLCKDFNFALFKFDAVCGPLRPEKEDAFIDMMQQCRTYSPDLILLNHRLGLKKSKPYATTFLFEGAETYIDVFMNNKTTAPHHRAGAISRGLIPNLQRLTEDHGVCISSCLDYWEDDLILQAFNRSLILSPQIYGNPWLLRDDEFSKLARIFNLHRQYKSILTKGIVLPETNYGINAVSRGDAHTRFITLRNMSWLPVDYSVKLNTEIGLQTNKNLQVIQFHPTEKFLGTFEYNNTISVTVAPFRSALIMITDKTDQLPLLKGSDFEVVKTVEGSPIELNLLGDPGVSKTITIANPNQYDKVNINGKIIKGKALEKDIKLKFNNKKLIHAPHRKLTDFKTIDIPNNADALYEATVFSADNNALEVRSLYRSGETKIPAVKKAREAFFNQKTFVDRGIWDKNLFDGDETTGFWKSKKYNRDQSIKNGTLRLDLGMLTPIDSLIIKVPDDFSLQPLLAEEGNYVEVSKDLKQWKQLTYLARTKMSIAINDEVRYFRFKEQPQQIVEIEGYYQGKTVDRSLWKASNLFAHSKDMTPVKAWTTTFTLDELANQSYLSVALNGIHGVEGAYVAAMIDGELVGAPDRAVSYTSNTWEYINAKSNHDYTYYIPLKDTYVGKSITIFVFGYDEDNTNFIPEVWLSSYNPYEKIPITLYKK